MLKPPPLRPGDPVRLVAPAGPFDRESFEKGLAVLSARYRPSYDVGVFSQLRYLAGPDGRRLHELDLAFSDPEPRAVFAARGGYGAMRILPELAVARGPLKLLIGFSDITAVHLLLQAVDRPSIHGPVLTQLGRVKPELAEWLFTLLETGYPPGPLTGAVPFVPGVVEGRLVGGNLSVLTRLLGTRFFPSLRGAVLLLEDVGERPYRIDRMWTHLRLAGVFDEVVGIALGRFTGCNEPGGAWTADEVLHELAEETKLPCAGYFAVGHEDDHHAVPLGVRVRLDAGEGTLTFLESVTQDAS